MKPLPLVDGALFVSGSFLTWVETCSRGAEYYKLSARVSAAPASALNFGSHVHTCHEFRMRQQEFGLSDAEIESQMAPILEAEFANKPVAEGDWRTLNWCSTLFHEHNKRYPADTYQMLKYAEPRHCKQCKGDITKPCPWCHETRQNSLMVEVPFVVKLFDAGTMPVYYNGFLDLPVKVGEQVFIQDYKTTSQLGQSFWDDKRANAAQKGYCWAFEQTTGVKIAGYLVRSIRTKEPPIYVVNGSANKKGEFKKIESWYDESFEEQRFFLGDGELEEWRTNAIALVEEFLWHHGRGYFPKRTTWCAGKYGRCEFYDVCWTFPVGDRPIMLNSGAFKTKQPRTIE